MRYKRQADSYVWCDYHGEIHDRNRDPLGTGENECSDREWRKVYVETDDRDEGF